MISCSPIFYTLYSNVVSLGNNVRLGLYMHYALSLKGPNKSRNQRFQLPEVLAHFELLNPKDSHATHGASFSPNITVTPLESDHQTSRTDSRAAYAYHMAHAHLRYA